VWFVVILNFEFLKETGPSIHPYREGVEARVLETLYRPVRVLAGGDSYGPVFGAIDAAPDDPGGKTRGPDPAGLPFRIFLAAEEAGLQQNAGGR
jgi:hypothetical protein